MTSAEPRWRRTLGMILPTLPQESSPSWDVASVAREAEEAGAAALWACDHLSWHSPVMECFIALGLASGSTSACALGTSVLQLPLRSAPLVAKQAASLDLASGGRFVLGVGVGIHEGEFEAVGAPFRGRGLRTEESLSEMRDLWSLEGLATRGRYAQRPAPSRIPVWIGGSGAVARRRAARLGDGWMPLFVPAHELKLRIELLREETEAQGRDADAVTTSLVLFVSCSMGGEDAEARGLSWMSSLYALPGDKFAKHLVSGSPQACAETIGAYFDAGVDHVVLYVTDDRPVEQFSAVVEAVGSA